MKGKVLGSNENKYETFVADTGSPVSIVAVNIAKKNGIKWWELDADELNYSGITGNQLSILGQTTITIKVTTIRKAQSIPVLICIEEGEESLIDLDTLKDMTIFPYQLIQQREKILKKSAWSTLKSTSWRDRGP